MTNLIAAYSKYLLVLLILCYAILTLMYLLRHSKEARSRISGIQRAFLFLLHITGFLVLFVQTKDLTLIALWAGQTAFFIAYMLLWGRFYPRSSRLITNNICALLAIAFIIQARLSAGNAVRQFIYVVIAGAVSLFIPFLMRWVLSLGPKAALIVGFAGLAALLLVLAAGGWSNGAKLNLTSIGIPVQPSEFVKISICFFIAGMLAEKTSFRRAAFTTIIVAANILVLVVSRDLGSALIFFVSYLLVLFIATQRAVYPLTGLGLGAAASVLAYRLFSHVRTRVQVWRDPWEDPTGSGYQVLQALFAVGTAGWFGMGLYEGAAGMIPLASSDFVFAAIAEELGGVFALCLILICFENTIQILWLSSALRNAFDKLLVSGLGIFYGVQIFINVGGVLKIIPSTGVTLPFVSSGGSSILASFISFAVIQACFVRSDEREEYERVRLMEPDDQVMFFRGGKFSGYDQEPGYCDDEYRDMPEEYEDPDGYYDGPEAYEAADGYSDGPEEYDAADEYYDGPEEYDAADEYSDGPEEYDAADGYYDGPEEYEDPPRRRWSTMNGMEDEDRGGYSDLLGKVRDDDELEHSGF